VQEGIGAVLRCCCIRELGEFDGPEVDKPDLVPDDSVKSFPLKKVNSYNSVAKPLSSTEIKARYNVRSSITPHLFVFERNNSVEIIYLSIRFPGRFGSAERHTGTRRLVRITQQIAKRFDDGNAKAFINKNSRLLLLQLSINYSALLFPPIKDSRITPREFKSVNWPAG